MIGIIESICSESSKWKDEPSLLKKIQLTYWKCFTLMMLAVQDQENQIIIILVWPHYSISILSTCPFSKVNLWAAMSLYLQEHSSWHRFQHHPFITSTVSTRMPVSVSSILLFQHTSVPIAGSGLPDAISLSYLLYLSAPTSRTRLPNLSPSPQLTILLGCV